MKLKYKGLIAVENPECRYCHREKEDVIYTEFGYCCMDCYELVWDDQQ